MRSRTREPPVVRVSLGAAAAPLRCPPTYRGALVPADPSQEGTPGAIPLVGVSRASPAGSDRWRRFRVRRGMQPDLSAPERPTRTESPMNQSAPHDPAGHGRDTYGRASDAWLGQVRSAAARRGSGRLARRPAHRGRRGARSRCTAPPAPRAPHRARPERSSCSSPSAPRSPQRPATASPARSRTTRHARRLGRRRLVDDTTRRRRPTRRHTEPAPAEETAPPAETTAPTPASRRCAGHRGPG